MGSTSKPFPEHNFGWCNRSPEYIKNTIRDEKMERRERELANLRQARYSLDQIGKFIGLEQQLWYDLYTGEMIEIPVGKLGADLLDLLSEFWTETV